MVLNAMTLYLQIPCQNRILRDGIVNFSSQSFWRATELIMLLHALKILPNHVVDKVILESDYEVIIQQFNSLLENQPIYQANVQEAI